MNMLGTGGYGGQSYDKVADIDWSKNTALIEFGSLSKTIEFTVESSEIKLKTDSFLYNINIVTKNNLISTNAQAISFTVK